MSNYQCFQKLKSLLWILPSVADAVVVHPNGINNFLGDGVNTFFIIGYPTSFNSARSPPINTPGCIVSEMFVFNKFILGDQ